MPNGSNHARYRQKRARRDVEESQAPYPAPAPAPPDPLAEETECVEDIDRIHRTYTQKPSSHTVGLNTSDAVHTSPLNVPSDIDYNSFLHLRRQSANKVDTITSTSLASSFEVIRLNVGDEIFTVPRQLLFSKDGNHINYFDVLLNRSCIHHDDSNRSENCDCSMQPPFVDETGAIYIDRDPDTFRLILNYLRGYHFLSILNEDQLSMLKTDARYFQLQNLMKELGDQTADTTMKFSPGPGVNPERNRFRVIYGVAVVGNRFLITGRHRITFQVLNNDYIGIGLVSDSCVSTDQEFHKTPHCCVYYMTGVFYSNFPHHRKEDGLEALEKDDYVSILVDMNKRIVEYTLKNSTKVLSIGTARRLRFAVAMKLSSSVRIVPEEEAQKLSLFQQRTTGENSRLRQESQLFSGDREMSTHASQTIEAGSLNSGLLERQTAFSLPQQPISPGNTITLFLEHNMDGITRPMRNPLVGLTARGVLLGSRTRGSPQNDVHEADLARFASGSREEQ